MRIILGVILCAMAGNGYAQTIGQSDIEPVLQQMQAAGKITAQEAEITRKYMQQMNASDWKSIEKKAEEAIERNPAAAEKVGEEGIDALNGSDFGISKP